MGSQGTTNNGAAKQPSHKGSHPGVAVVWS